MRRAFAWLLLFAAAVAGAQPEGQRFLGSGRDAETLLTILGSRLPRAVEQVGHSSVVLRLDLDGLFAAFKPRSRQHPRGHLNEAAAYRLAALLGMDNVPPTRIVRMPRRPLEQIVTAAEGEVAWDRLRQRMTWDRAATCAGANIYWIPDLTPTDLDEPQMREAWAGWLRIGATVPEGREGLARDLSRMVAFDYLIANFDRFSGGNVSTTEDGSRLYVRDHNVAFTAPLPPHLYERVRQELMATERFDPAFLRALVAMDRPAIEDALAEDREAAGRDLLTEPQLEELLDRRRILLTYISGLVAVHGLRAVLLPATAGTEEAPCRGIDVSDDDLERDVGDLFALVVHDLRNPVATISANVSFVREVDSGDDPDVKEALEDVEVALNDLMRGIEQIGWIGRWMAGEAAIEAATGEVRASVQQALGRLGREVTVDLPDAPLQVKGGGTPLARIIEILLVNAAVHAPGPVTVRGRRVGAEVWVETEDSGRALAGDLREAAMTLPGQQQLKGRADGRYSRVAGLFAIRALAEGIGARFEAAGTDGAAIFRVRLAPAD